MLDRLLAIRPEDCPHVFPTRDGNACTDRGFKTLWQRCMRDAIDAEVIPAAPRFIFHDLRAFYATQHKNPETTARVYDRNKVVRRSAL